MEKDCRNCEYYKYNPKEQSSPYGEEYCGFLNNDFAGDYTTCEKYNECLSLLSEITEPQKTVINIITSNLGIEFYGVNKGDARDFIRKNIAKSRQRSREHGSINPNSMIMGCHGLPVDKADFYSELVPNQ